MKYFPAWLPFALGSAFFASLTAIFGKFGVSGINSNVATLIRTVIILVVTAGIITMRSEWQKPDAIPLNSWWYLIWSGVATGLSWLCYYRALQIGPVTRVAPIDKLSVAFAILLSVVFVGEKLSWPVAVGGALIVSGSIVIAVF
ncbi:MAG: EamA family transporter [Burkholderiaceae bacterium]|nr:EamA family transporter [Burkholderiaceae bacterium]